MTKETRTFAGAAQKLRNEIIKIMDDPNKLSFWMGVDTRTGKADLVPIMTKENMEKLEENYDNLHANIQKILDVHANIQKILDDNMIKGSKDAIKEGCHG